MDSKDKSFLTFLRTVYKSELGEYLLVTIGILFPMLGFAWLYSPSDFAHGSASTFNAWWIIIIGMVVWIHAVMYNFWRHWD